MTPDEKAQFIKELAEAMAIAHPLNPLSEDETRWVRLAIQKEAQSLKLRQAIIEKSLTGLVWAGIAGLGVILAEYLRNHGFK